MTESELVKVYTVNDPNTAELIKNLLVDHGLECHLDGEHQAGFTGTFEIGVLVRRKDESEAKIVLDRHHADEV